jgi:cytidylate kinase
VSRARPVIAIDGPAGAGKSTVALGSARELGFLLVDTGALYRGVALAARDAGLDWNDAEGLGAFAVGLDLDFERDASGLPRLRIGGLDRAAEIRTPEIAQGASKVSAHPPVRTALLDLQRRLGEEGGVVLEGRDIGTVVFPDAEVKIFLTASDEERARRRVRDLAALGIEAHYESTLAQIQERDARDRGRAVAPLRPADDAVTLDTTALGLIDVIERVVALARDRSVG